MTDKLGYVRLGDLSPGTVFTVETLKRSKKGFKITSSKQYLLKSKWKNLKNPKDDKLMKCAPFLGGAFQESESMMSFLSINEMVKI